MRLLAVIAIVMVGCGERARPPPPPGTNATNVDSGAEAATSTDAVVETAPFEPTEVIAETIFSGPSRTTTPPSWNAHLPKLAADDKLFYAVHTHFTESVGERFAVIMRRPRDGGAWVEAARVFYPHQPPGIVMDRTQPTPRSTAISEPSSFVEIRAASIDLEGLAT